MSVNVLERLLFNILNSTQMIKGKFTDRWMTKSTVNHKNLARISLCAKTECRPPVSQPCCFVSLASDLAPSEVMPLHAKLQSKHSQSSGTYFYGRPQDGVQDLSAPRSPSRTPSRSKGPCPHAGVHDHSARLPSARTPVAPESLVRKLECPSSWLHGN